jgi:hypothetical protein
VTFSDIISWLAVILILAASTTLLLSRDWRLSLGMLTIQYLAAFWLITRQWPIGMASVKLVTGWMVIAALGMTRLSVKSDESEIEAFWPRGQSFRIFLAGIVALLSLAAATRIQAVIPGLGLQVIIGSLLLICMGLIHLGITSRVFRVVLGLLTALCGFEIIYAAVESSILVAGLLAITNLGLGLTGSYLLLAASSAEAVE